MGVCGCCVICREIYSAHPERVEPRNSLRQAAARTRQHRGFFVPGHSTMAGRATDTRPERERSPPDLSQVSSLLAASCSRLESRHEASKSRQGACHV